MTEHTIKCYEAFFTAIATGRSGSLELDEPDHTMFKFGDTVRLQDFDRASKAYTGAEMKRWIHAVIPGGTAGVRPGSTVLLLAMLPAAEA